MHWPHISVVLKHILKSVFSGFFNDKDVNVAQRVWKGLDQEAPTPCWSSKKCYKTVVFAAVAFLYLSGEGCTATKAQTHTWCQWGEISLHTATGALTTSEQRQSWFHSRHTHITFKKSLFGSRDFHSLRLVYIFDKCYYNVIVYILHVYKRYCFDWEHLAVVNSLEALILWLWYGCVSKKSNKLKRFILHKTSNSYIYKNTFCNTH